MDKTKPIHIACLDIPYRDSHYSAVRQAMPNSIWRYFPLQSDNYSVSDYDLAVVTDEFCDEWALRVREAVAANIPVLHFADGILEWRNTWENPRSQGTGMPLFQPVLAHKIACLGRSQARLLESWGNLGKCEYVGAPRLDRLRNATSCSSESSITVLVMTAKTPAFSAEQRTVTLRSLRDVKTWFETNPKYGETQLRARWRVSPEVADAVAVPPADRDPLDRDLAASLADVQAVITTPSTAMLEAMLCGLPVAVLNYHNRPLYVPAAWEISAESHIDRVIHELIAPPKPLMLYQNTILHDSLECRTDATTRAVRLIEEMVRIGRECRAKAQPLQLPRRILCDDQDGHHMPELEFDLAKLYPGHPVFSEMDRTELQTELGHARSEIARLRQALALSHKIDGRLNELNFYRRVEGLPLIGQVIRAGRRAIQAIV